MPRWTIGDDDHNTVFEDPDEDRDLHLLFSSRADAERHPERGRLQEPPLPLADFPEILDRIDARGEGLAPPDGLTRGASISTVAL